MKNNNDKNEVQSLARHFTEDALKTLVGIMNDPEASVSSRVSAAQTILDRGWGKLGSGAAKDERTADVVAEFLSCLQKG